ncbi:PLP-dependent transferase [Zopfia rhizophila CBS 207.26]|uniref:PLP-dependent transferase n=1 Tax=Zopfia rhizophila CBS 207.26 TaxID=1314779 RepID=A0A6A6DWU2_9PEZI|nr:PLP-dependent transferase [Zopfia rhizophila CBS 207.26]
MDFDSSQRMTQDVAEAFRHITSLFHQERSEPSQKPIVKVASPTAVSSLHQYALPEAPKPIESVVEEAIKIFSYRLRNDHPRFFGFIPSPAHPLSWLGEMLCSLFNTHGGSWLQSSGPSTIEAGLINFLATKLGLPSETAGGLFVSGGSMANLTGMTMARDRMLGSQEARLKGCIYVSEQTHFSVTKGLKVLGFVDSQIRKVPVNSKFRFDVESLKKTVQNDRAKGLLPFAVVATCGATNTGSIDPLQDIADVAQKEKLWMHVDGAYGASIVLSKSYSHLADGLGRADSISLDAHKWFFQTFGCGIVFVREKKHLLDSFAANAEYVRDAVAAEETPNFWSYGIELTLPARAMKLWFTMRVLGLDTMGALIDHGVTLAERAEAELRKLKDWEIFSPATLAIVVFRYAPRGLSENGLDELNIALSKKLLEENIAGALTTKLHGKAVLRVCAISPQLSLEEMTEVITKIDETAKSMHYVRSI